MQVPDPAMRAALRWQGSRHGDPVGGDQLASDLLLAGLERIVALKAAHQGAFRIQDFELHRRFPPRNGLVIARQKVVDNSTGRRVLTQWLVWRDRSVCPGALGNSI